MKITISSLAACFFSAVAQAAPTELTYWDFLGGGDGVRMKQIVEEFNKSQSRDPRQRVDTDLGRAILYQGSYGGGFRRDSRCHDLSSLTFPAGIASKDLRPITTEELAKAGLKDSDFQQSLIDRSLELSKTYGKTDQLFGVPLDIHTIVLYYNKTALQKAGLLDADGKPSGLDEHRFLYKDASRSQSQNPFDPDRVVWNNFSGSGILLACLVHIFQTAERRFL